ncbi:MAG: hypothetical protein AAGG47_09655 [Pseudomonadota bacterium]
MLGIFAETFMLATGARVRHRGGPLAEDTARQRLAPPPTVSGRRYATRFGRMKALIARD